MRKKIMISLLLALVILMVSERPVAAKADSDVIVFYDSLAKGTANEGNIDSLLRMLNSLANG